MKGLKPHSPKRTVNLNALGFGHSFLDRTPKAQAMGKKMDTLDFIRTRNCYAASKRTAPRVEENVCSSLLIKICCCCCC